MSFLDSTTRIRDRIVAELTARLIGPLRTSVDPSSTANAIIAVLPVALSQASQGLTIYFRTVATNTSDVVTLKVGTFAAAQLYTDRQTTIPIGALAANKEYGAEWAGTYWRLIAPLRATATTRTTTGDDTTYVTPNQLAVQVSRAPVQTSVSDATNPNAQLLTATPSIGGYYIGCLFVWRPNVAPTAAAFTLNVDGLGPIGVVGPGGAAVGLNIVAGTHYLVEVGSATSLRIVSPIKATDAQALAGSGSEEAFVNPRQLAAYFDNRAAALATVSTTAIVWYGDSQTAGQNANGSSGPYSPPTGALAAMLPNRTVSTRGRTGQTSTQIAERANGYALTASATGDQIPASGGVVLTAISGTGNPLSGLPNASSPTLSEAVTLAGVPGYLTRSGATYTFTRQTAGTAIACPANSPLVFTGTSPQATWVIWSGQNNKGSPATVRNDVLGMLQQQSPVIKRRVVVGTLTFPNTSAGVDAAEIAKNNALNNELRRTFGECFADILPFMLDTTATGALADQGIAPTSDDLADAAAGLVPRSLRSSPIDGHLNANGYAAVGRFVGRFIIAMGW